MMTISTDSTNNTDRTASADTLKLACRCARVADELRGGETIVLDLSRVTPIADYFVITTGTSRRQMHAIADEINQLMKETDSRRIGIEGYDGDTWVLQE